MSKTKFPDAVAYAHRDILRRGSCVERIYPAPRGTESLGLYTADQLEAYAAARVQEMLHEEAKPDNLKRAEYYGDGYEDGWKAALEKAARACEARIGQHSEGMSTTDVEDCDEEARECASAIRSLLPSTPA